MIVELITGGKTPRLNEVQAEKHQGPRTFYDFYFFEKGTVLSFAFLLRVQPIAAAAVPQHREQCWGSVCLPQPLRRTITQAFRKLTLRPHTWQYFFRQQSHP